MPRPSRGAARGHRRGRDSSSRYDLFTGDSGSSLRADLLQLLGNVEELLVLDERYRQGHLSAEQQDKLSELAEQITGDLGVVRMHVHLCKDAKAKTKAMNTFLRLGNGAVAEALLRLMAVAARLPPFANPAARDTEHNGGIDCLHAVGELYGMVFSLAGILQAGLKDALRSEAVEAFALKLVRTQTPQACAQQLKTAVDRLKQGPVTEEERKQAEAVLGRGACLIRGLAFCAYHLATYDQVEGPFLRELSAALEESCVLEHATQLLLRLPQPLAGAGAAATGSQAYIPADPYSKALLAPRVLAAFRFLNNAIGNLRLTPVSPPHLITAAKSLRKALNGPCLTHTAVVAGLSALCSVDGGPAYGLPSEVLGCFQLEIGAALYCGCCGEVSSSSERGPLSSDFFACMIQELGTGRLGRRASQLLLMRTVRQGLAAAHRASAGAAAAGAAAGREGSAGGGSGGAGLRQGLNPAEAALAGAGEDGSRARRFLSPVDGVTTASKALKTVWELLEDRPALWLAQADEWWRNLLALCSACTTAMRVPTDELQGVGNPVLGTLPSVDLEHPPPEVPAGLAAALAAGLLPGLERIVRRAAEDLQGAQAEILFGALDSVYNEIWPSLGAVLAYGEPRQAAALVVSVGKLLRREAESGERGQNLSFATSAVMSRFLASAAPYLQTLAAATAAAQGTGEEAADASHVVSASAVATSQQRRRQLGLMVSYAATEWLPPLLRTLSDAERMKGGFLSHTVRMSPWVPLLVTRASDKSCSTAAASAPGQAGTSTMGGGAPGISSGGGPGGGSSKMWRRLLIEEMGVVTRLGAALPVLTGSNVDLKDKLMLVDAALAVAAAFPGELQDVTRAAVEEAIEASHRQPRRIRGAAACRASGGCPCGKHGPECMALVKPPWHPEAVHAMVPELRAAGLHSRADGLEALASHLKAWRSGATGTHAAAMLICTAAGTISNELAPAARLLAPPGAARRLIGSCANPGCVRLEGDTELGGPQLQVCGGCRAVGYCCRECQTAHRKAGHREDCAVRRGG